MKPRPKVFFIHHGNTVLDCSPQVLPSRKCKTSAQPGKHQNHQHDRESTQSVFHGTPRGPTREDDILAVSVEENDQVLTAIVGNWDRTSTRGLEHNELAFVSMVPEIRPVDTESISVSLGRQRFDCGRR